MDEVFKGANHCLRASPEKDHTIGFFVACFRFSDDLPQTKSQKEIKNEATSSSSTTVTAVQSDLNENDKRPIDDNNQKKKKKRKRKKKKKTTTETNTEQKN